MASFRLEMACGNVKSNKDVLKCLVEISVSVEGRLSTVGGLRWGIRIEARSTIGGPWELGKKGGNHRLHARSGERTLCVLSKIQCFPMSLKRYL